MLSAAAATLLAALACGCSERTRLPRDPALETFIQVSAKCAYADRAYSKEPDLLGEELTAVKLPEDWTQLVDALLADHGADPGLWYEVYSQIVERSRK